MNACGGDDIAEYGKATTTVPELKLLLTKQSPERITQNVSVVNLIYQVFASLSNFNFKQDPITRLHTLYLLAIFENCFYFAHQVQKF